MIRIFVTTGLILSLLAGCSSQAATITAINPTSVGRATATIEAPLPTPSVAPTQPGPMNTFSPTLLPEWLKSSWIAFTGNGYESGIYVVRADGSDLHTIMAAGIGFYEYLSWSPDGHHIVFTYAPSPDIPNMQIYTVNIDGSDLKRLTFANSRQNNFPAWSPDGKYISYSSAHYVDNIWVSSLLIMDKDGNIIRELADDRFHNDVPIWDPDGKTIYYLSSEPDGDFSHLMAVDVTGQNKRLLANLPNLPDGNTAIRFALSPNGRNIFFRSSGKDYCGDFYLGDIDGGNLREIVNFPGDGKDPNWSSDSGYLVLNVSPECYYTKGSPPGGWQISVININTGRYFPIIQNQNKYYQYPAWSPVPALQIKSQYVVTDLGDRTNLREEASLQSNIIKQLQEGDQIIVLEGPLDQDGYYWWKFRTNDGIEGWAVEVAGWYKFPSDVDLTLTPKP